MIKKQKFLISRVPACDEPFGHELPSSLSLRVEDMVEWLSRVDAQLILLEVTENFSVIPKTFGTVVSYCSPVFHRTFDSTILLKLFYSPLILFS